MIAEGTVVVDDDVHSFSFPSLKRQNIKKPTNKK
jgi:hypothetical protein